MDAPADVVAPGEDNDQVRFHGAPQFGGQDGGYILKDLRLGQGKAVEVQLKVHDQPCQQKLMVFACRRHQVKHSIAKLQAFLGFPQRQKIVQRHPHPGAQRRRLRLVADAVGDRIRNGGSSHHSLPLGLPRPG